MHQLIKKLSAVVALFIVLVLAGCQTSSGPSSNPVLSQYRLTSIVVNYSGTVDDYHVHEIEKKYRETLVGTEQYKRFSAARTPQGQQVLRDGITRHVRPHIQNQVAPLFVGTTPLTAEVTVSSVYIASALRRFTGLDEFRKERTGASAGGLNKEIHFTASMRLVDAQTGFEVMRLQSKRFTKGADYRFGDKPVVTGESKILSDMAYDFAVISSQRLRNYHPALGDITNRGVAVTEDEPLFQF